jgi:diaminopimelate epimerase
MSSSNGLPFYKIVGTGNDFLFLDFRNEVKLPVARAEFVRRIANRHLGVGSDGVVFVEKQGSDLKWDFYNPDGSSAAMCGNALRCMGRWAKTVLGKDEVQFHTRLGLVTVRCEDGRFNAQLKGLNVSPRPLPYEIDGAALEANLINTGVPHAVVRVSTITNEDLLLKHVPPLRRHPAVGVEGANVTFVQVVDAKEFKTVTFERGVEGFTLSCGTGVLAAAAEGLGFIPSETSAKLTTPGGVLEVIYKDNFSVAHLIGPAEVICSGVLEERFLR